MIQRAPHGAAGVGHDSWDMTYDPAGMNDIYTWLLSHEKP
jgi:hypothetical protein